MRGIEIELPIIVVSEANRRDHWRVKHARSANQKASIQVLCRRTVAPLPDGASATIALTRLGKRKLDSDNLAGAFKAVRDAVAELLGVDDGSDRLVWLYAQQGPMPCIGACLRPDGTGIRIKIEVVE